VSKVLNFIFKLCW